MNAAEWNTRNSLLSSKLPAKITLKQQYQKKNRNTPRALLRRSTWENIELTESQNQITI